ncbi:hypothetical protein CEQ83_26540 (plasmid) [Priestia megaterium]|uniref:hypothetical protein n=1 Tax=Priestia megaterium TaxID=1404 RepID=UPI0012A9C52C|nr:hypothetical protein [Priestia megaterium]QFY76102.1 hypothetical protein CEQ83_26540 [Priestia megaterium]
MATYAERRTLTMLNALKKIDECSRNKEFKAKLQAYCKFVETLQHLNAKFKERGIGLYPKPGTFLKGVEVGHDDALELILNHIDNYKEELVKMMGLSFFHTKPISMIDSTFYGYGKRLYTFEHFIEKLKTIVWDRNGCYIKDFPALVTENLALLGLLPNKILNEFKIDLLQRKKENATDCPKLIVKNNIKIELLSKNI